jgi:hypothetical protein
MNPLPRDKKREVLFSVLNRKVPGQEIEMAIDALEAAEAQQWQPPAPSFQLYQPNHDNPWKKVDLKLVDHSVSDNIYVLEIPAEAQQVPLTTLEQIYDQWKDTPITHGGIVFAGDDVEKFESRASFYGGYTAALANIPPAPTMSREEIKNTITAQMAFILDPVYLPGTGSLHGIYHEHLDAIADALEGRIPAKDKISFHEMLDNSQKLIADLERQHAEDVERIKVLQEEISINRLDINDLVQENSDLENCRQTKRNYKDRLEAMVRAAISNPALVNEKGLFWDMGYLESCLDDIDRVTEAKE